MILDLLDSDGNFLSDIVFEIDLEWLCRNPIYINLDICSLSGKKSYRKISWSIEAARFGFRLFQSL